MREAERIRGEHVDIPPTAVWAFVFGVTGIVFASVANLIVAADLLTASAEQDLTEAAAPTMFGLAFGPVIAIVLAVAALMGRLRRQRLGHSVAWAAIVLGVLSLFELFYYSVRLSALERELQDLQEQVDDIDVEPGNATPDVERPEDPFPPTSPPGFAQVLVTEAPQPGPWNTLDGSICSFELVDYAGDSIDFGNEAVIVVPEGVAAFYSDGCAWAPGTGD